MVPMVRVLVRRKTAGYEGSQLNDIIDYKYANDKGCKTMNMTDDNKNLIQGFMRRFGDGACRILRSGYESDEA